MFPFFLFLVMSRKKLKVLLQVMREDLRAWFLWSFVGFESEICNFSVIIRTRDYQFSANCIICSGRISISYSIYDFREMEEKSTIQESLNPFEKSTKATANSKVSRYLIPPLISATATSSATMKQDKIVAKARAYNDLGGLMGTETDSAKNSSYAGATVRTGVKYISRAIGNHTYEKSGYVTVNPNEKKVFQLKLPEADKKKNYQVLAFPFPYKTSFENFESHTVEGTFRTVIQPK